MVGYFFLIIVLLLFAYFLVNGITNWRKKLRAPASQRGLIVNKYLNEAGACIVVLQVGQEERHLEISPNLYPKIHPPIRGELHFNENVGIAFISLQK